MTKPLGSLQRVAKAADDLGLTIEISEMEQSTRTAEEAAAAAGCHVAQIVKSLIFEREDDESLVLVLVSGAHNADLEKLAGIIGSPLRRADPRKIRNETGFAIGGVSAIGHINPIPIYMDETLLDHEFIWAAAGKPNAVFKVSAAQLKEKTGPIVISIN